MTFQPLPDPWPTDEDLYDPEAEPALTLTRRQLGNLARILTDVDEFLRTGGGSAALVDFYRSPHSPRPAHAAGTLIDTVAFAAEDLRTAADDADIDPTQGHTR